MRSDMGMPCTIFEVTADSSPVETEDGFAVWWSDFLRGKHLWDDPSAPALNVVDLFCGSGGFGMGAALAARCFGRRAVFRAIADADSSAMNVYERSLPVRKKIADSLATIVDYSVDQDGKAAKFDYAPEIMHSMLANEVGNVDLLIAGPPCQGHSNLNNHTRRNDPRNDLFVATAAIAVALRAGAVVIENVPSVVRSHGDVVELARQLLLSEGYAVTDRILRMDELGGWQTRARYFMIAVKEGVKESFDAAFDLFLSDQNSERSTKRQPLDVLWAISDLQDVTGGSVFDSPPTQGPENARRIDYLFDENKYDLPNSERPDCHKEGTTYTSVYGRMRPNRPAPTITTGFGTPGQGRFIHPTRRRLITPHEAARIQCFPDGYGFMSQNVDTPRKSLAKWIGDAVPPILGMMAICTALSVVAGRSADLPWATRAMG